MAITNMKYGTLSIPGALHWTTALYEVSLGANARHTHNNAYNYYYCLYSWNVEL